MFPVVFVLLAQHVVIDPQSCVHTFGLEKIGKEREKIEEEVFEELRDGESEYEAPPMTDTNNPFEDVSKAVASCFGRG